MTFHFRVGDYIVYVLWRTRRRPSGVWQGGLTITIGKAKVVR